MFEVLLLFIIGPPSFHLFTFQSLLSYKSRWPMAITLKPFSVREIYEESGNVVVSKVWYEKLAIHPVSLTYAIFPTRCAPSRALLQHTSQIPSSKSISNCEVMVVFRPGLHQCPPNEDIRRCSQTDMCSADCTARESE